MQNSLIVVIFIFFQLHSLNGRDIAENMPSREKPPHIIFIIADDLGWNDVGFHGSNQIPTPNIDALAYNGLILNNYYVNPICTPSRSALMTGKYPIHTGMQHRVLYGAEPRGLPLNETLLPQHLQRLGYSTHIVGKWHLGSYKLEYTPTFRGFESHIGYWTGHHDYFDHTAVENPYWGLDMRRGVDVAWDLHGQYSTKIFTEESEKLINNYNSSKPLFLYIAHAAVHSGNPYNPLPAPDNTVAKFSNIANYQRRKYAAMVSELDDSVGRVVAALKNKKMLKNSIIIFTTDNGGPADGFNLNAASNWPLRGTKNTSVKGSTYNGDWDGWYGPSGHEGRQRYDIGQILGSKANRAISSVMTTATPESVRKTRHAAIIRCGEKLSSEARFSNCKPLKEPCLFNIVNDPCERENLASSFPTVLKHLEELITVINKTVVPPSNLPWDEKGNPANWGNTWTNFGDSE
ncbi:UNVERIFIED_CONTAM: hypothetical protein PYX00_009234 [Menopon gallinae]|uniref:Sulfatase N-terminal domain-containing protein n=1 Tax=Menopon gallinae TaxID=328185 RepID=A0AAW2HAS8_9NEOP